MELNQVNESNLEPLLITQNDPPPLFSINKEDLSLILEDNNILTGFSTQILDKKGGIKALFDDLNIDPLKGITDEVLFIEERKHIYGSNILDLPPCKTLLQNIFSTFKESTMIFLIIVAFFRMLMDIYKENNKLFDILSIYAIIMIISILNGIAKTIKNNIFLDLHKELNNKFLRVLRNEEEKMIHQSELLVGDILILSAGDTINNDGIIIKAFSVELIDHKGETKSFNFIDHCDSNGFYSFKKYKKKTKYQFILSGSSIIKGFAYVLILSVGEHVSSRIISKHNIKESNNKAKDELLYKTNSFLYNYTKWSKSLFIKLGIVTGILVFIILMIRFKLSNNMELSLYFVIIDNILNGMVIIIIAMSEGLPLVLLLTVANSIRKLNYSGVLIKNINSLEDMACCNLILNDYKGVLTRKKSNITSIYIDGKQFNFEDLNFNSEKKQQKFKSSISEDLYNFFIEAISLTTIAFKSEINGTSCYYGYPNECALINLLGIMNENYSFYRNNYNRPIIDRSLITPDSTYYYTIIEMSEKNDKIRVYVIGEYYSLIEKIAYIVNNSDLQAFTNEQKYIIDQYIEPKLKQGSTGLIICFKDLNRNEYYKLFGNQDNYIANINKLILNELTLISLIEMRDDLKDETIDYIANCERMGVDVKIFCNSSEENSILYAKSCGLLSNDSDMIARQSNDEIDYFLDFKTNCMIDAKESKDYYLNLLKNQNLCKSKVIFNSLIDNKHFIIRLLSDFGYKIVVMSDCITKKEENTVSISCGKTISDIVKESSDIINNDNLNNITESILHGKHFYITLSKFLQFYSTFVFSLFIILIITNLPFFNFVFYPNKLLWIGLITNTFNVIAFSLTSPWKDYLTNQKPYIREKYFIPSLNIIMVIIQVFLQFSIILTLFILKDSLIAIISVYQNNDMFNLIQDYNKELFKTIIFHVFVLMQVFNAFICRTQGKSNFFFNLSIDYMFLIIQILIVTLQISIINVGSIIRSVPLSSTTHLICILISSIVLITIPISILLDTYFIPKLTITSFDSFKSETKNEVNEKAIATIENYFSEKEDFDYNTTSNNVKLSSRPIIRRKTEILPNIEVE